MKSCRRCNISKPIDAFENNKQYIDGKQNVCRICRTKERKEGKERRKIATDLGILYEGVKCEICLTTTTLKNDFHKLAVVDHCHTTNKIRGILCRVCNGALGKFNDNANTLERAYKYLKKG